MCQSDFYYNEINYCGIQYITQTYVYYSQYTFLTLLQYYFL